MADLNSSSTSERREIRRLLIVRLGAMGDIIHTLPAVAALRAALPQADFGWIVEERWAELLCAVSTPRSGQRSPQRPLADRLHVVNTARWRSSLLSSHTWEQAAAGLSDLRAGRYEVAVDFQGAIRSAILARLSRAPIIYGFRQPRESIASMFYTREVLVEGTHIIEQNRSLAEAVTGTKLGIPRTQFPLEPAADQQCERLLAHLNLEQFAILNPGAGWGAKRWPPERYGYVSKRLAGLGLRSLVNFGPGEEDLARAVEAASAGNAIARSSSLTELIALTRRARLFIGGDTGPLHLAAALGIPVVGIYGPTNPARNGPYGTCATVLRSDLSQTNHSRRAAPELGLLAIGPEEVFLAARQLLGKHDG
jgi:heptosyltransferase-1